MFSCIFCFVRYAFVRGAEVVRPKNEEEAIELLTRCVDFAENQSRVSFVRMAELLKIHSVACTHPGCECKELESDVWKTEGREFHVNTKTYTSNRNRPEIWRKGCVPRILKVVFDELEPAFCRNDDFCVSLAEAHFYYLANFYYAWERISIVMQRKPSLLLRQRIYNLIRVMHTEIECSVEEVEDPERTVEAIEYMNYYNEFIEQIETSTEHTMKFWATLLSETPSSQDLNSLSRLLFESKSSIVQVVQNISRITSNHIDFLIRYGLFMRYVMHDTNTAEQAFKHICQLQHDNDFGFASSHHRFSIFRGDASVMLLIASLDGSGAATICEVNDEVERRLNYTREELLGTPATNLMPPTIAQVHDRLVQAFFRTMDERGLGIPLLNFVKKSDGSYLPCDTLKKVVPRLSHGLQVIMFLIPDPTIRAYAGFKFDQTQKRVGAVICDSLYRIAGFTKEAMTTIGLDEAGLKDAMRNTTLQDLFPQLSVPEILAAATTKEGAVIAYDKSRTQIQGERDSGSLMACKRDTAATGVLSLVWIRMVEEDYAGAGRGYVMLLADIVPEARSKYVETSGTRGLYKNKEGQLQRYYKLIEPKPATATPRSNAEVMANSYDNQPDYSRAGSVMSVEESVSMTESEQTKSTHIENISSEMQMRMEVSKETPMSIIRLYVVTITLLAMIVALISMRSQ